MVRETVLIMFDIYRIDILVNPFFRDNPHLVSPKYKIKRVCSDQTSQQKDKLNNKIEHFLAQFIHFVLKDVD